MSSTHTPRCVYVALALIVLVASPCCAQNGSCTNPVTNCDPDVDYFPNKITIEHAKTVIIDYNNTYVDLRVTDVSGTSHLHRLVRCGCSAPNSSDRQVINVPPARLFVDDGPSLAFLTHSIPQVDRIVAVGNPEFIYSESIRTKFSQGTNTSVLATRTDIDVAFINLFKIEDFKNDNVSIPYFANGESNEVTPLGRSEWIKIFGLMFNAVESANSKYDDIVSKYSRMKQIASNARRRPSVLLNNPFGTKWSLPSEGQYITQLLRDANVDYRFMNNGRNDTLSLTLEEITGNFSSARYLIHYTPFPPITSPDMSNLFQAEKNSDGSINEDMVAVNKALRSLSAVRCGNVWARSKKVTKDGANDVFEFGSTRPDLLLEDIVHGVHPQADVDNKTTFSFKMNNANSSLKGGECPYNDLLNEAPKDMGYIDSEFEIKGMNRFQVEDVLVSKIIPEVARDERIERSAIEAFFEKPQEENATTLLLRTMVKKDDEVSMLEDAPKIRESVQEALGSRVEVTLLGVEPTNGRTQVVREGPDTGTVLGIVFGCLAMALLVGILLFVVGSKRGREYGENEMRDRFWREHGVRLIDDEEERDNTSAALEEAEDGQ